VASGDRVVRGIRDDAGLRKAWEEESPRPPNLNPFIGFVLIVVCYVGLAQLARVWTLDMRSAQPFYPAAGVGVAFAFFIPRHVRLMTVALGVGLGAAVHHATLGDLTASDLVVDLVANVTETIIMVLAAHHLLVPRLALRKGIVLVILAFTALASAAGATIASIGFRPEDPSELWLRWFIGDGLGMLAVQALPYVPRLPWIGDMSRRRAMTEAAIASLALFLFAAVLFLSDEPISFLVLPAMAWLAIKYGPRASVPMALVLVALASIQTAQGYGPFAHHENGLLLLQTYNASIIITAQLLGVHADRADTERRRLRGLLVALPDTVTLEDMTGRYLYAFIPPGHRGPKMRNLIELLPAEEQARAEEARMRVMSEGRSTDTWAFNNLGKERHFESRSARVGESQILTVTREITDAVHTERDLRAGERMWRTLADTAAEGILVVDASTTAIFANGRVAEILGWPADAIEGSHLSELTGETDYERIEPYRTQLRNGERVSFEIEIDIDTPEHRWVLTSANPIMSDGVYAGAIALFSDTTSLHAAEDERRAIEERLRSVESSERRRLAQQLHDGPIQELVAADLRLGALRRSLNLGQHDAVRRVESIVEDAVAQLRAMMSDLLPPEDQPGSVIDSLEEHVERVVPTDVEVQVRDLAAAEPASSAANVLYHIGREAITNAVRHANAGRIEIILSEDDGGFRLQIRDDGSGMDVERAPAKRGHLGLRSMFDRAEVVGGRVVITSGGGNGTTVDAWIPSAEPGSANLYDLPAAPV
jgi:PAS domain S-box-containing protein